MNGEASGLAKQITQAVTEKKKALKELKKLVATTGMRLTHYIEKHTHYIFIYLYLIYTIKFFFLFSFCFSFFFFFIYMLKNTHYILKNYTSLSLITYFCISHTHTCLSLSVCLCLPLSVKDHLCWMKLKQRVLLT